MFKKIDLYIIKKFLGTFFFTLLLFVAVVIVVDYSEKTDNFAKYNAPAAKIWFDYFLNLIPYLINMFIPLFTFIAVVFFTSKMAYKSEIIAILSSGVSFNRLLRPYFISALVIGLLSFFLHNYIIPPANEARLEFESIYVKPDRYKKNRMMDIHKQVLPGVYVYIKYYFPKGEYGRNFVMEKFENNRLKHKLIAEKVTWDKEKQKWKLRNCKIREFAGEKEILTSQFLIDTSFNLLPEELVERKEIVVTMNLNELSAFIKDQEMKGTGNIEEYKIEKYKRLTNPLATFVLTLIGVSLASRKMKGGIGLHLGLGLLISFAYIFFMKISTVFAVNGGMPSLLAVLLPSIFFSFVAVFLYLQAPK